VGWVSRYLTVLADIPNARSGVSGLLGVERVQ